MQFRNRFDPKALPERNKKEALGIKFMLKILNKRRNWDPNMTILLLVFSRASVNTYYISPYFQVTRAIQPANLHAASELIIACSNKKIIISTLSSHKNTALRLSQLKHWIRPNEQKKEYQDTT